MFFENILKVFFSPKPYSHTASLWENGGYYQNTFEGVDFELEASFFSPKPYLHTASLRENGGCNQNTFEGVDFELVSLF